MLRIDRLRLPVGYDEGDLKKIIQKSLRSGGDIEYSILRRSLDARKKPDLFYDISVSANVKNEDLVLRRAQKNVSLYMAKEYEFKFPDGGLKVKHRPVVIGFGPSGMFASYMLAKAGLSPIVFERGFDVDQRTKDVEGYFSKGSLNPSSNIQFGEGGAGTYSDGKLGTTIKDPVGRLSFVLKTFVKYGAPERIVYDHKPHVGTDALVNIVKKMREDIIRMGADIRFGSCLTGLDIRGGKLAGIKINDSEYYETDSVFLCIGHSARDTFRMLLDNNVNMEAKPFAVGIRIEHPSKMINLSQYGRENVPGLLSAEYRLTHHCEDHRGVYTFCMCPGGYIVNASSEEGMVAVNGMSYSGRSSQKSNSAVVVTVDPKDFGDMSDPLCGVSFQRKLERKAFECASGAVPVERYIEFKTKNTDKQFDIKALSPHIKGMYEHAPVHEIFPGFIHKDIVEGIESFSGSIAGFNRDDALIAGVESRTSSPVRIVRDDDYTSNIEGIYPVGEGAGYAGGITSAAIDGIKAAESYLERCLKEGL